MTPAVLLAAGTIPTPSISYSGLLPVLIVLGAACVGVLVEAFLPEESRWAAQTGVALVGLIAALVAVVVVVAHRTIIPRRWSAGVTLGDRPRTPSFSGRAGSARARGPAAAPGRGCTG